MTCVWHRPSLVTAVRVNLMVKSLDEATVLLHKIFSEVRCNVVSLMFKIIVLLFIAGLCG